MKKEITVMKASDWSLNLEDPYYETHQEAIFTDSLDAIRQTKSGCYVNLVTPGVHGDPREWLIEPLTAQAKAAGLAIQEIRYVDECGCGGYVTRAYV